MTVGDLSGQPIVFVGIVQVVGSEGDSAGEDGGLVVAPRRRQCVVGQCRRSAGSSWSVRVQTP